MDDLITWLRQQLEDDEQAAKAASPGPWSFSDIESVAGGQIFDPTVSIASVIYDPEMRTEPIHRHRPEWQADATGDHIARHDPAAVLADIAAKRAVLLLCEAALVNSSASSPSSFVRGQGDGYQEAMTEAVRYLASAYRHRPGWKDEWEA